MNTNNIFKAGSEVIVDGKYRAIVKAAANKKGLYEVDLGQEKNYGVKADRMKLVPNNERVITNK